MTESQEPVDAEGQDAVDALLRAVAGSPEPTSEETHRAYEKLVAAQEAVAPVEDGNPAGQDASPAQCEESAEESGCLAVGSESQT